VPLRIELGPKDMDAGVAMLARRDTGAKQSLPWDQLAAAVPKLLEQIQVGSRLCVWAQCCAVGCVQRAVPARGMSRLKGNRELRAAGRVCAWLRHLPACAPWATPPHPRWVSSRLHLPCCPSPAAPPLPPAAPTSSVPFHPPAPLLPTIRS
jgi:hypothetical protein